MVGLTVRQARQGFFDRRAVIRAVGKAKAAVLSKFGAFVRQAARSSIRPGGKKGKVSKPGEPPRSHVGWLREFIQFAWDWRKQSVVVGPARFAGAKSAGRAPGTLERGGPVLLTSRSRKRRLRQQTVRMAPRPYMGPALRKNVHLLPPKWANSIRPA
jgi:hypothetical protein